MRHTLSRGFVMAAAVTGALSLYSSEARADSPTEETTVDTPDMLSGNTVEVPLNVPVDVCGTTISAITSDTQASKVLCDETTRQTGIRLLTDPPLRIGDLVNGRPAGDDRLPAPPHGGHDTSLKPPFLVRSSSRTDAAPGSDPLPKPRATSSVASNRPTAPLPRPSVLPQLAQRTPAAPLPRPTTPTSPVPVPVSSTSSVLGRHTAATTPPSAPPTTPTSPPPVPPSSPTMASLGQGWQAPFPAPPSPAPATAAKPMAGTGSGTEVRLVATAATAALLVGGVILYRRRRTTYGR